MICMAAQLYSKRFTFFFDVSTEKADCLIPAAVAENPQIGRSCSEYDKILLLLYFFLVSLRD